MTLEERVLERYPVTEDEVGCQQLRDGMNGLRDIYRLRLLKEDYESAAATTIQRTGQPPDEAMGTAVHANNI